MNMHTYAPPVDAETLSAMYIAQRMTQMEIAAALGCSRKAVTTAMRRFNIQPRIAAKRNQDGPSSPTWKGDEAGYQAMHLRVARLRGKPSLCETCRTTTAKAFDWANLTGKYNDPMDYRRLCRSCHWKMDGQIRNITGG